MIIKGDAAQLEWRTKVFLAQDQVGIREILEGFDLHSDNQKRFGLPSRTIAKNFIYRMIFADAFGPNGYRGPAYAYAHDADFAAASTSIAFWEKVVESCFEKYQGVREHGVWCIRQATSTGRITNPSGRFYNFKPYQKDSGEVDWPRTNILNYPVQGFAADLMQVARLELAEKLPGFQQRFGDDIVLINTVHDDIELDVDNILDMVYNISILLRDCFRAIPSGFKKRYGSEINVPFDGEVKYGWTLAESTMLKFNEKSFEQDWAFMLTKPNAEQIAHYTENNK